MKQATFRELADVATPHPPERQTTIEVLPAADVLDTLAHVLIQISNYPDYTFPNTT